MPNMMAALPNIGGALCSTLTPTTRVLCSNAAKTRIPLKLPGVPQTNETMGWCPDGGFWRLFWVMHLQRATCSIFHLSDLHSKFALGPRHVSKYGRHPRCSGWD